MKTQQPTQKGSFVDQQTLVNILVEIAELEQLRLQAEHTVDSNAVFLKKMAALQAEYEADASEAAGAQQGQEKEARSLERELEMVEAHLKERNDRLIGVTDRRQHQALLREIASLEQRREDLEEAAIASLDSSDQAQRQASRARSEQAQQADAGAARAQASQKEAAAMSERLGHIDTDLQRLLGMLPPVERKHVERLMDRLDRAVVGLKDGACTGCFNQLPQQEAINVERGRTVMRCPSCRRFLVRRSWKS